jgi:hypothetical protein
LTLNIPTILFVIGFALTLYILWNESTKARKVTMPTIVLLVISLGLVLLGLGIATEPLLRGG